MLKSQPDPDSLNQQGPTAPRGVVPWVTSPLGKYPHSPRLTSCGLLRYWGSLWVLPTLLKARPSANATFITSQDTKPLWSPRRELPTTLLSSDKGYITMQAPDRTNPKYVEVATRDRKLGRLLAWVELQKPRPSKLNLG